MQQELIKNLISYSQCYLQVDNIRKNVFVDILKKHQHIENTLTFLEKVHTDLYEHHNFYDQIITILIDGFYSIIDLEEKQNSTSEHWDRIKRFEKQRKNIVPYINGLISSQEIYQRIDDPLMNKRIAIALKVFESFLKDDDLILENLALASYYSKAIRFNQRYDQENKIFISIPYDSEDIIEEDSLLKSDIKLYMPELVPFVTNFGDLIYLASLSNFFDGYRLTPQMILRSVAIKLYNNLYMVPMYCYDEDGEDYINHDAINKSALKRSIESLLLPFSESEKFTVDIKKFQHYYVKTYFRGSAVLALEGKNNKNKFRNFFNPDQYYKADYPNSILRDPKVQSHKSMFM